MTSLSLLAAVRGKPNQTSQYFFDFIVIHFFILADVRKETKFIECQLITTFKIFNLFMLHFQTYM
jgi:hypothetical protein